MTTKKTNRNVDKIIDKQNFELQRKPSRVAKITLAKKTKVLMPCMMTSKRKTCYMFIGNYSGISKFSFGILFIMIHRLTL